MNNPEVELEDQPDADVAEQHLAEVRAATGKDVQNAKEKDKTRKPVDVVDTKPVPKTKGEIVEDFQEVEAQLAEEETLDELAEFEKFDKEGSKDKVSTKPKEAESKKGKEQLQQLPTTEPKAKKENSTDKASESKAEKIEKKASSNKKEKSVDAEEILEESKAEAKAEESEDKEKAEDSEPHLPKLTPEQLEALTKEAKANMTRALRRDQPDAFTLGPKITDWDQQRASWLEKNPDMKSTDPHKPKVLLLTGSQPWPCNSPVGDHYLLKMIKNKVDYSRIHKLEIFYSFAHLDKPMSHFWAKLPLIRKMMLMRPEVEWIFWMDSDALFTDMVFEIPFENYQDHNLVMWGYPEGVYDERSWVACNTGVMFLRNNQWTLDLLEVWSHFGPEGYIRNESGRIMSSYLARRPEMMADDQSALVYLLITEPELRPKIYLEDAYYLSGYWVPLVGRYEEFSEKARPGIGGWEWPFTTHFTGCQPCSGVGNELYEGNSCLEGMERAFNFADNQVLKPFGFEHESLQGAKVLRIRNETTKPIWSVPVDNPWSVESFYS